MNILTGIDLPFTPNCGSIILVDDLYSSMKGSTKVRYLGLQSEYSPDWSNIKDIQLLSVKKVFTSDQYPEYVKNLSKEIHKQINEFKPDIIHIQHLSFGMALAFSQVDLPKIAICHGTDVQFSQGNDFHKNNMIQIYKKSDLVIFPTEEIRKEFYKLTEVTGKDIILPWGLPDTAFEQQSQNKKLEKKLLYAGRLDSNKNVKIIIEAMKHLESDVTLTIIGEGDQKELLRDLVKRYKLGNRINFFDFQPRKELWKKFKEYNVFIIPTEKIEAFGLTPVEAQAHGLPVLYSKTNGLLEVLGNTGISFDPTNALELAQKINMLFTSSETYFSYVELGRKNAAKYTISNMQKKLINLSKKVIKSKRNE